MWIALEAHARAALPSSVFVTMTHVEDLLEWHKASALRPCCQWSPVAAGTKQELKQLYDDRQVVQFAEFYPVGHR